MSREIFGKSSGSALTGLLTHYTSSGCKCDVSGPWHHGLSRAGCFSDGRGTGRRHCSDRLEGRWRRLRPSREPRGTTAAGAQRPQHKGERVAGARNAPATSTTPASPGTWTAPARWLQHTAPATTPGRSRRSGLRWRRPGGRGHAARQATGSGTRRWGVAPREAAASPHGGAERNRPPAPPPPFRSTRPPAPAHSGHTTAAAAAELVAGFVLHRRVD